MTRNDIILKHIDRHGKGLEIGPSHSPVAPKCEGFNVEVVDHLSRGGLVEKYENHGVDLDRIEEVDYVWNGEPYAELTGKSGYYDWIIASHVIEHAPDLISFLRDCDEILSDGGILSLVIPDKRFCFDRYRPLTGLASLIDSFIIKESIHSPGVVAEYCLNVVSKGGVIAWDLNNSGEYMFVHDAQYAMDNMKKVLEEGRYFDAHKWCFVPHSFRLLINDLHLLGFTRFTEIDFHPTCGSEFYITLGKSAGPVDVDRMKFMKEIDAEVSAEFAAMIAGAPSGSAYEPPPSTTDEDHAIYRLIGRVIRKLKRP